jgi:hypothetical protein
MTKLIDITDNQPQSAPMRFYWSEREEDGAELLYARYADGSCAAVQLPNEIRAENTEELIAELATLA